MQTGEWELVLECQTPPESIRWIWQTQVVGIPEALWLDSRCSRDVTGESVGVPEIAVNVAEVQDGSMARAGLA